jgi:predicted pyridoxine 5'-phosphate oxidase superfamily flavin-nucleotide-binding protein
MSKLHDVISPELSAWLTAQPVFFVATAPLSAEGHVNCSPKSGGSLCVTGPKEVAWIDFHGSGAETAAHLRENGRIVLMFCAFDGEPNIVRLHGRGEAIVPGDARFAVLAEQFSPSPGLRSIIRVSVNRVSSSCGWGVPVMRFADHRTGLEKWAAKKGAGGLDKYRAEKNARSIDGLPAFDH